MKKQKKKIINNEIEDKDIFIRIDPDISLESKKDLLEINEALIETQIAAEKFKQQRREEMKIRMEAKKNARETSIAVGRILNELPKEIKIRIKEEREAPARIEKPKVIKAGLSIVMTLW